jgi:putative FmdB family regulatory protein
MPIFDYRCACGERFERLVRRDDPAPDCPMCGGPTTKAVSLPAAVGHADPGPSREQMPQTWRGTYSGNREYVTQLRRQWEHREKLEAKHPELRGDTRPVIAHEGRYEHAPLRAGEPAAGSVTPKPAAGPSGPTG